MTRRGDIVIIGVSVRRRKPRQESAGARGPIGRQQSAAAEYDCRDDSGNVRLAGKVTTQVLIDPQTADGQPSGLHVYPS